MISIGAEATMNDVLFLFRVTRYRSGFQLSDLYRQLGGPVEWLQDIHGVK